MIILHPPYAEGKCKEELLYEHQKLVEYLAAVKYELYKHDVSEFLKSPLTDGYDLSA